MVGRPSPPGFGGMAAGAIALFVMAGAGAIGAVVGLASAVVWIRKRGNRPWKPRVWWGSALGLLSGLALHLVGRVVANPAGAGMPEPWPVVWVRDAIGRLPGGDELAEVLTWWPVAAVFAGALGLLGGTAAALLGAAVDRRGGKPPLEAP
jgi:hypothetical protein